MKSQSQQLIVRETALPKEVDCAVLTDLLSNSGTPLRKEWDPGMGILGGGRA